MTEGGLQRGELLEAILSVDAALQIQGGRSYHPNNQSTHFTNAELYSQKLCTQKKKKNSFHKPFLLTFFWSFTMCYSRLVKAGGISIATHQPPSPLRGDCTNACIDWKVNVTPIYS